MPPRARPRLIAPTCTYVNSALQNFSRGRIEGRRGPSRLTTPIRPPPALPEAPTGALPRDELADDLLALARVGDLDERARVERAPERARGGRRARRAAPPHERVGEREQRGQHDEQRRAAARAERVVHERRLERAALEPPQHDL